MKEKDWQYFKLIQLPRLWWYVSGMFIWSQVYSFWWLNIAKKASDDQRAAMADVNDWRERFDAAFYWDDFTDEEIALWRIKYGFDPAAIKAFISKEIERAREEERNISTGPGRTYQNGFEAGQAAERERIIALAEGIRRSKEAVGIAPSDHAVGSEHRSFGFNSALDTLISKIKGDK